MKHARNLLWRLVLMQLIFSEYLLEIFPTNKSCCKVRQLPICINNLWLYLTLIIYFKSFFTFNFLTLVKCKHTWKKHEKAEWLILIFCLEYLSAAASTGVLQVWKREMNMFKKYFSLQKLLQKPHLDNLLAMTTKLSINWKLKFQLLDCTCIYQKPLLECSNYFKHGLKSCFWHEFN